MPSPLIRILVEQHNYPMVDEHTVDQFLQQSECSVLFFTENPKHHPESNDVAVILPELMKRFGERVNVGVVDCNAEQALRARYPFNEWPALEAITARLMTAPGWSARSAGMSTTPPKAMTTGRSRRGHRSRNCRTTGAVQTVTAGKTTSWSWRRRDDLS